MDEVIQAPVANSTIDNALRMSTTHEMKDHNVRSFLQRAYAIDNFTWSKTSPVGSVLATYRFPDILLSQPALAAKTRNFFGLRAGVELLVLINKQQFQAGNLLISYLPNAKYNAAKVAMAQTSLQTLTGMPRTNLDLMDATRATLKVPYASPFVYYNLLTNDGTIGDFYITVYSPLSDVAEAGTVSVQVFARFIDVDLEFPTGSLPTSLTKTSDLDGLMEKFKIKPDFASLQQMVKEGQMIMKGVQDNTFRFQMNNESNFVSNMKLRALPNMAVSSDTNNAHIMSLSSSNALPSTNMGETTTSEMNINSILQVPCYHDRFPVSNQASGVNVWSKLVQPQVPITPNADGSIDVDYIHYHTEPFSKWRGSIIYHFRAVKTTFHSLRVRVWFSPASLITDVIDRNAVYSKIVDLKDTNHFTFEVPFVWPHPFLNVHVKPMSLGTIGVDIVNAMVFPATVDSTINFIVERSAGTDFCVNLPTVITAFPFNPTVIPTTRARSQHRAREGVSNSVAQPIATSSRIVLNGNVLPNVVQNFRNIPQPIRNHIVQKLSENPEKYKLPNLTALNELGNDETITLNHLHQSLDTIVQRFNSYDGPNHHIELRALPENKLEIRNKRDLTREGVEKNPGPTQISSYVIPSIAASQSFSLSNSLSGANHGVLSIFIGGSGSGTLTTPWGIVGLGTNNNNVQTIPIDIVGTGTSYTFTLTATATLRFALTLALSQTPVSVGVAGDVNVVSSIPLDVNVSGPDPLNVNIEDQTSPVVVSFTQPISVDATLVAPLPLPVTGGGGGGSSIVATTSVTPYFSFQMNMEQDSLRPGYDDLTFHRPVQSTRADSLSLGGTISDIRQMIKRSSAYANLPSTVDSNLIMFIPHAIGVLQKDDDGLLQQNANDLISYYAAQYAFARGGINLRLVTAPDFYYNMILDPDSTFFSGSGVTKIGAVQQNAAPPTTQQLFQLNNPLQQIVKPSLEGFGEVSVPFYSDTFMYSISPEVASSTAIENQTLQLPYSQLILQPNGAHTKFQVFRAACSDFEFSYLTGPPKLFPFPT